MKKISTSIPDVILLEPKIYEDERGYFLESYNKKTLEEFGIIASFVQDNLSFSKKSVLRGLHYQIESPQGKLVKVLSGEVFDAAVDLRQSSPTFGKWAGFILSEKNQRMAWIPPGFAHGFFVLSETAHFFYKCTDFYNPKGERTIIWNDPTISIDWPNRAPSLSEKDANGARFRDSEYFI